MKKWLIVVVGILSILLLGISSAREITCADNPLALWQFEEGSGVDTNDSCYNYTCTVYGTPHWVTGMPDFGYALDFYFDGGLDNNLQCGYILQGTYSDYSVSLWVNLHGRNIIDSDNHIFELGTWTGGDEHIEVSRLGGGNFDYWNSGFTSNTLLYFSNDTIGDWHYLVDTFNATDSNLTFYLDGIPVVSMITSINSITISDTLLMSASHWDWFAINGSIDDVAFFNRTLTQAEVLDFFNPLTAPTISNITATVVGTNSTIDWNTNLSSNSTVCYWKTGFSAVCLSNSSNSTLHSITITGLEEITWYNYFVSSCTSLCTQSANYTFETLFNYTTSSSISSVFVKDNQIFKSKGIKNIIALCYDNNSSFCNGLTECDISVWNPEGEVVIDSMEMTWFSTHYSYNITTLTINGDYSGIVLCSGQNAAHTSFNFKINPNGEELNLSKTIFYIVLLLLLIGFLVFSMSKIFSIDNYAWTLGFVSLSYILFMGVSFISYQLSINFLTSISFISSILYIFFYVSLIGFLPFFLISVIYLLSKMLEEKEVKEMMDMGYSPEEAKERVKKRR